MQKSGVFKLDKHVRLFQKTCTPFLKNMYILLHPHPLSQNYILYFQENAFTCWMENIRSTLYYTSDSEAFAVEGE